MRTYDIDSCLESGACPELSLECYTVSCDGTQRRTLTRYSSGDILSQYIDVNSIHAEWAYNSSDIFDPGGVIPVSLSFRLLPGHELSHNTVLKATFNPKSATDYSYLFRPKIRFKKILSGSYTYVSTYPLPYMILKEKRQERGDQSTYKLYFEDENCVFEYAEFDIGSYIGESLRTIVYAIVHQTCLGDNSSSGIAGSNNITGTSYYDGESMSARKVLSYIAQMNGVFITRNNETLSIKPMLDAEETDSGNYPYVLDGEIPHEYVLSTYKEEVWPSTYTWKYVTVRPYNSRNSNLNEPDRYFVNNNPFIVSDNYGTYQTLLYNRIRRTLQYSGHEVVCRFNPNYEIGDYLKLSERYIKSNTSYIGSNPITVARIVWNGGAFCTVYGARFGGNNRK